jgi:RES domain
VNYAACSTLLTTPENRTWFRVFDIKYLPKSFVHKRMKVAISRFNAGRKLSPADQFACFYVADDPTCAQFEVGQQLGFPTPGSYTPNPTKSFASLSVAVLLQEVVDISDTSAHAALDTSVQELTGDWLGFDHRNSSTSVSSPTGIAPTQHLGEALFKTGVEGFRATSAKLPWHKTLVIFPDNMKKGSSVVYSQSGKPIHSIIGSK